MYYIFAVISMEHRPELLGTYRYESGMSHELEEKLLHITQLSSEIRQQVRAALTQDSIRILPSGFSWKRTESGIDLYYVSPPLVKDPEHNPISKRKTYGLKR